MAILYVISMILLWTGIVLCRKSEQKQNLAVWCICAAMLNLAAQVFCGGIIGQLGIPITCASIGIANLLVCAGLGIWIARKGTQAYEIGAMDIISVGLILAMTLVFGLKKFGIHLDRLSFISVDSTQHCRFARTVALEHRFMTNRYFTSLPTGLMMQVQLELTGCRTFELYKSFLLSEIIYTTLAAELFWALLRQRCGEGKWKLLVPLLITPFYWAGYPVYTTMFGFSYLGAAVSLINLELILLDQMCRKKTDRIISILGLNLVLYGVFVSYTLFVPVAFFGAFITILLQMREEAGGKIRQAATLKNVGLMLAVFLVPSVLGMLYSFVDLGSAAPGGDIAMEGGCYNDMYSSFILPLPFAIMGLYFVYKKSERRYLLPMLCILVLMMGVMLIGLTQYKVSVYYYVKNNNLLWLMTWVLVTEAIWGMMERTKWAALFPLFFYCVLGMGKYGDEWLNNIKGITTRVAVWNYVDLILVNNTYFNHAPDVSQEMMDLYRYVDEHYDPQEVMAVNQELPNKWYRAITGGNNYCTYDSYEEFLQELEDNHCKYILGIYSGTYRAYQHYLDTLEVITENEEGKIFKIPEGSRPTIDAPREPEEKEEPDENGKETAETAEEETSETEQP